MPSSHRSRPARSRLANSPLDRAAERRDDDCVLASLRQVRSPCTMSWRRMDRAEENRARARSGFHAGGGQRARQRRSNALPRLAAMRRASASGSIRNRRKPEGARRTSSSPICVRSPCRALSPPNICRRSQRPRRCCTGMRGIAFARIAARRPISREAGWRRDCPQCKAQHFPRTDPVAIMLAVDGDNCLLGRPARFVPGFGRASRASSSRAKASKTRYGARRWKKPASAVGACAISRRSHGRFRCR